MRQLSTAWGLVETAKLDELHSLQQVGKQRNVCVYSSVEVSPAFLSPIVSFLQITTDTKNYETYRDIIDKCVLQPVIPFINVMLRDMWQLDEALKSNVQNGLINFEKFRKIHTRISTFAAFKDHSYTRGFQKTPRRGSTNERSSTSSSSNWGKNLKQKKITLKHDTEIQKLICCRRIRMRKKGSKLWELGKKINKKDSKKFVSNLNAAGFL